MPRIDYANLGGTSEPPKKKRKAKRRRKAGPRSGLQGILDDIRIQKESARDDEWSELHNMESRVARLMGKRQAVRRQKKSKGSK